MELGRKEKKKKVIGQLRRSQLITTFGPGAIADMPDYSVIIADAENWTEGNNFHEPNLQNLLGKKYFKEPKTSNLDHGEITEDIPSFRFPRMLFCPKCHKLKSYINWAGIKHSDIKKCPDDDYQLVPSRFIIACINGHLEDFPYKWWVHHGHYSQCSDPDNLEIHFLSNSGGLGSIEIECMSCHAKRSMEGCMNRDALKGYKCHGKRPWIGIDKRFNEENCGAPMQTLQRGASNVYFSITQSAITIPPWSCRLNQEILKEEKAESIRIFFTDVQDEELRKNHLRSILYNFLKIYHYSDEDILNEVYRTFPEFSTVGGILSTKITRQELFEAEYRALCTETDPVDKDIFKNEESEVPAHFRDYISNVFLVRRLREVMVLKGFRRITPSKPSDAGDPRFKGADKEFMPVSHDELDWLPANRLYGEGIFLRFNEDKINEWTACVGNRYDEMKRNLGNDESIGGGKFSPQYVLLHTFSHLLIRQLTAKCGYSGSALRERIYSTFPGRDFPMAGILIYTSSSDSDGSLGGLVRQGESDELDDTILNLLQDATWCSSDPLCIESKQQGYNSLNYAACHACTLLPETSCEARNCLLDRVAVVGKESNRKLGFFGDMLIS